MAQRMDTMTSLGGSTAQSGIPPLSMRSLAELQQLCMRRHAFVVQLERELAALRQPSDLEARVEALEKVVKLGQQIGSVDDVNASGQHELLQLVRMVLTYPLIDKNVDLDEDDIKVEMSCWQLKVSRKGGHTISELSKEVYDDILRDLSWWKVDKVQEHSQEKALFIYLAKARHRSWTSPWYPGALNPHKKGIFAWKENQAPKGILKDLKIDVESYKNIEPGEPEDWNHEISTAMTPEQMCTGINVNESEACVQLVIHLDEEGLESATARVPLEEVFAADISAETLSVFLRGDRFAGETCQRREVADVELQSGKMGTSHHLSFRLPCKPAQGCSVKSPAFYNPALKITLAKAKPRPSFKLRLPFLAPRLAKLSGREILSKRPAFCVVVLVGTFAIAVGNARVQDWSSLGASWTPEQGPPTTMAPSANQGYLPAKEEVRVEQIVRVAQICNPRFFGAVGDGKTDDTDAFRSALQSCSANRSMEERFTLEIPAGTFLIGSVNLTSKMTLRLLRGSKLLGVSSPESYPLLPALPSYGLNRDWALDPYRRHSALLCGYNLSDVIIEGSGAGDGEGVVDGDGSWWWSRFSKTQPLANGRPSLIQFMYCTNITIRFIRLQNPAFWNTHFYASQSILVEHVNISAPYESPNTDGVNLDSVVNAIVRSSEISTGDDAIAIKSGLNQAGIKFAMPSAHIHLHDLIIHSKCLSVGSEMSGGIYDVRVENVKFGDSRPENLWHGIFIKSSRWRGGTVRDLSFQNIRSVARSGAKRKTKVFIEISMQYGSWNGPEGEASDVPPSFFNFSFDTISSNGAKQIAEISGLTDSPITDIVFKDIVGTNHEEGITCRRTRGVRMLNNGVKNTGCLPNLVDTSMRDELDRLDPPTARDGAISAESWLEKRKKLISAIFDGNVSLPTKSNPDQIQKLQRGLYAIHWDLPGHGWHGLRSTVFVAPLQKSTSAVLWHHGHHDCVCPDPSTKKKPGSKEKTRKYGVRPGWAQGPCRKGCMGAKHTKIMASNGTGYTWWDLDNVTRFFHSLGHNVFILSMPLVGVNFSPGRSTNWTDHWWFQTLESGGESTIRYFCEPVILTINYALSLGFKDVVLAGLSGGGWTTSLVAAMDSRITASIPVAGVLPWYLRFARTASGFEATGDIGDYEQICALMPFPFLDGARHKGYGWRVDAGREYCQACNYKCQFLLAGLEPYRWQLQILHEDDTCCYAAAGRHDEIRAYETDIRTAVTSQQPHGWFTVVVTDHRLHEFCAEDKMVIEAALTTRPNPKSSRWDVLPCDVLHGKHEVGARDVQVNFVADSEYPMCFGGLGGCCVPEASTWEIFMDDGSEQEKAHPVLKLGLAKAESSRGRWQEVFTQWQPWQSAKAMKEAYANQALEGSSAIALEDGDEE
ncbi:unnamed protein product [Symbiodinium natans]|uniref:Polygalacturonase n=1 Tax=Symbiodinium natans TaxID=878477 RepID=A0A812QA33_9DINO|nr:unnamed protein product [Symbiodinium natans]